MHDEGNTQISQKYIMKKLLKITSSLTEHWFNVWAVCLNGIYIMSKNFLVYLLS